MFNRDQAAYHSLRDVFAERTQRRLLWVGSGISVQAGLPTWPQLVDAVVAAIKSTHGGLVPAEREKHDAEVDGCLGRQDPWLQLECLRRLSGTTFDETVRQSLSSTNTVTLPAICRQLWRLRPSGVLSFNLDRLLDRSFNEVFPGRELTRFVGRKAGDYGQVLSSPAPFVANLHGVVEDRSSWVLTRSDLRSLHAIEAYRFFLHACLSSYKVIFLAIRADDVAARTPLEELRRLGLSFSSHYWITDRQDAASLLWAEQNGIQLIHYSARGGDHSELIELLDDLESFVPSDEVAPPVALARKEQVAEALPPPAAMAGREPEEMRILLNAHAKALLGKATPEAYEQYADFCSAYDRAIYGAWYHSLRPPNNILLGYTLEAISKPYRRLLRTGVSVETQQTATRLDL